MYSRCHKLQIYLSRVPVTIVHSSFAAGVFHFHSATHILRMQLLIGPVVVRLQPAFSPGVVIYEYSAYCSEREKY